MPVVLFRVDERLIHGQVVMGWGPELRPDHYLVADDELADSEWEQDLYRLGLPDDATAEFLTVNEAQGRLAELEADSKVTIILTRSIAAMADLAADGSLRGREVNLGGVHHAAGRTERLPYVFLSAEDETGLRALEDRGAVVSARDLPSSRAVGLASLLS